MEFSSLVLDGENTHREKDGTKQNPNNKIRVHGSRSGNILRFHHSGYKCDICEKLPLVVSHSVFYAAAADEPPTQRTCWCKAFDGASNAAPGIATGRGVMSLPRTAVLRGLVLPWLPLESP